MEDGGGNKMAHTLTLEVPQEVYESLARLAEQEGQSPEALAAQWVISASQHLVADPLERLIGTLHSDVPDWGERHDYYIGQELLETYDKCDPTLENA